MLQLSWFKSIDANSYERAKDIFEYHLHFLANIACWLSSISLAPAPKPASKLQHYTLFKHRKDKAGTLKYPLLWWKVRLSLSCALSCYWYCSVAHWHEFPIITHMAYDFLTIPGAMVSIEHLFLKSWHLCTDQHSSLKAATLTQAVCTKEWLQKGPMKWDWGFGWTLSLFSL